MQSAVNIKNRRATFDFEIIETYTAGIVLTGTEIKSIRQGKAGLTDSFCYENNGELWIKNMYIGEYFYGSYNNHASRRDRKLLLKKKEIREIGKSSKDSGFSIVPLRVFINDKGLAKVVIALAKGKKVYDKRQTIKEKRTVARSTGLLNAEAVAKNQNFVVFKRGSGENVVFAAIVDFEPLAKLVGRKGKIAA